MIIHTATRVENRPGQLGYERDMRHWRVTLRRVDEYGKTMARMSAYFSQGKAHTEAPKCADVLGSLYMDSHCPESYKDFCEELGYDYDSRKAEKIWKECRSIAIRVKKLIGTDGVWLLRDGEAVQAGHPNMLVGWMHRNHSFSWSHALEHEGYSIEAVS